MLLVLTIQGSIWINFAVPALQGQTVFFIAYLIVSAIQMGATIDYAIVISNRYLQLKKEMQLKDAMIETLNQSFPTIFTSGSILTCAGFLIGEIASDATVASIGVALGRGTLISIILVLFVLPQILLLGDIIIEKTALTMNIARPQKEVAGRVRVTGHVKGYVQGEIDADIQGTFQGQMKVSVDSVIPGRQGQVTYDNTDNLLLTDKSDGVDNTENVGNIIPYVVQAEEADSDVIVISSARELIEFANNCKYDSYSRGRTVRLATDINLSNTDFNGIPYFDGTFDGANHTIRSFNVDYKGSDYGFFRYLGENAYVCNFSVSGSVNTSGSQKNIGGIAGVNYGTITNCTFYGKVNGTTYVGAIAGINKPGANITNCLSDAVVTATNQTGGIAGKNEGLISECVSRSRVNTDELASSLDVGGVDVGTFNITQHVVDRNDMGGIAGNSSGVISSCTNYGTIGYNHTGYNVGGIAGSQNGKILNCTNEGDIYGRKDVGGIVGQAEPYIESEYLQDRIDTIQGSVNNISNTLNSLSDSMSSASSKTRDYAESITNQYKEDADVLSDSLKEVSDSMQDNPDTREYFDNINNALNKIKDIQGDDKILSDSQKDAIDEQWDIINDNLKDISNTMADSSDTAGDFVKDVSDQLGTGNITGDIQGIVNVLVEQIQNISDSINTISSQINNIGSTVNDTAQLVTSDDSHIEDISTAENAKNTDGVITKSVNRGTVYGDLNVGGITGTMNIEYDVDPEYDLDLRSSTNVKLRSTVNDIVIYCVNYGEVTSRKDCAGGITGLQELGLIYGCEGYGSVKSETGDYAGGIAGNSVSSVSDNYSLCNVESDSYAGGICGQGYTVKNNVSIATISGDGEKKGVIAGTTDSEGSVRNNIFVSDILGGIDDINYSGIADKVTYDYVMSLDNIPEGFHQITITFK